MFKTVSDRFNPGFWRSTWQDVQLTWSLLRDPRVSLSRKLIPAVAVLYLFSPVDIALDFIPILGQLDDLAILLLGVKLFIRSVPEELVLEHRSRLSAP